jgi:hypothetical protein
MFVLQDYKTACSSMAVEEEHSVTAKGITSACMLGVCSIALVDILASLQQRFVSMHHGDAYF